MKNDETRLARLALHHDLEQVLIAYGLACDRRDWALLGQVFHPDVEVNYGGEFHLRGLSAVRDMIASMLGGCGPTQHLLGNLRVELNAGQVSSAIYVRAVHAGAGELADTFYEVWAEYLDRWAQGPDGWRITHRTMHVSKETGSRAVLRPAP